MNTANVAVVIFNAFEKFENDWQADLCTRSKEKLQPAVDATVGLRSKSQWMTLTILREYVKWCIAMKVPEACVCHNPNRNGNPFRKAGSSRNLNLLLRPG